MVQTLTSPRQLLAASLHAPRLVVDLIAPLYLETAALKIGSRASRRILVRWKIRQLLAHLAVADLVLCTTERQRDLMLGLATTAGLMDRDGAVQQPGLHERIAVVSYGIDEEPPVHTETVLRGTGTIGPQDSIALWAGGLWHWLDPLTPIRAIGLLKDRRPDLKLVFIGLDHPHAATRRAFQGTVDHAIGYARELGLEGAVIFRRPWLDEESYRNHLLEADVGISAHPATLEARYAIRSRILDYLSAGLPVVCTSGDTMGDFVASEGLGRAIAPLDVEGCAAALDELTRGEPRRLSDRALLEPLHWRNVARPLLDYCREPGSAVNRPRLRSLAAAARDYPAFAAGVYASHGTGGLLNAVGSRLTSPLRGR